MNHHVTLTPSQRAWNDARKAREADRARKAMRLKSVAPAPKPIEPPIEKPKPRLVQVAPAGQIIFHAIKTERPNLSFPQVGHWMGNRDHTTALHAVNKIQAMIDNGTFDAEVEEWHRMFGKARAQ